MIFLAVLLAPAVLTMIAASTKSQIAFLFMFIGSGVAALACGIIVARGTTRLVIARAFVAVVVGIGLYAVSVALCFFGCALGLH
jgi:hypothetical protein